MLLRTNTNDNLFFSQTPLNKFNVSAVTIVFSAPPEGGCERSFLRQITSDLSQQC